MDINLLKHGGYKPLFVSSFTSRADLKVQKQLVGFRKDMTTRGWFVRKISSFTRKVLLLTLSSVIIDKASVAFLNPSISVMLKRKKHLIIALLASSSRTVQLLRTLSI